MIYFPPKPTKGQNKDKERKKTMTRSFKVTITTKKGEAMPTEERIHEAVFGCGMSWDSIRLVEVEAIDNKKKKVRKDGKRWNLQKLALVDLGLSNLQVVQLNEIGSQIADGMATYQEMAESLSNEEAVYLFAWLENEGIKVTKGKGK